MNRTILICLVLVVGSTSVRGQDSRQGDAALARYFAAETRRLADRCLDDIQSMADWNAKREEFRSELLHMLGLDPWPERTPLELKITNEVVHDDFVMKCLHFQSAPGLYVTANLYLPKEIQEPLPAVLYVCGHGRVRIDGVDYGSKVYYQHHPTWYARNGYVCLTIDTVQLGEIAGIHHGTYREGMWWWLNRGYTPAGVEAWNCVRALDLLESMDEVDGKRLGVTGRSGGGAYSWWIAAIDERIRCAVPVAGITDLENHVVDGCVEGHCDCMYFVNTFRWDYTKLAALVAPRPLLISNTDSDPIFPLDGVYRTYEKVRRLYGLLGAKENLALNVTAGPHKDTQELRVHAFRWMNRHLKGDVDSLVLPTEKVLAPEQLKVFDKLPKDAKNGAIHEDFVPVAKPELPRDEASWIRQRREWMSALRNYVFAGWPEQEVPLRSSRNRTATSEGVRVQWFEFDSQEHVRLPFILASRSDDSAVDRIELRVLDQEQWSDLESTLQRNFGTHVTEVDEVSQSTEFSKWLRQFTDSNKGIAYFPPRGIGPTQWDAAERKRIQIRRRFYLLGQTRDAMRVYDVRRAVQSLEDLMPESEIVVYGQGQMAAICLYASLFEPQVGQLVLRSLPKTHREGPYFLNVRRYFDLEHALAMLISSKPVLLADSQVEVNFARHVADLLDRGDALEIFAD